MALLVSTAKDELAAALHTTNLDKVRNVNGVFNRAGRELLLDIDPQETIRVADISVGLFDGIFDYSAPSDLKGDKVIDIRPKLKRVVGDNFQKTYLERLDLKKKNQDFTVESRDGTKVLRVSKSLNNSILFNNLDSLTANGTWTAAGGATNLAVDNINYVEGGGSLSFDVGATGGYIENSSMTQVDFTNHKNKSSLFVDLYVPTPSSLTSVTLRWGNDSSNFFSRTVTVPHFGSFKTGWNLLRFDWSGSTETGSTTITTFDYIRVLVTTTVSDSGYRVDAIYSKLRTIYEAVYYSRFLFQNSAGTWQETVTADTDSINLDTDAQNLFMNKLEELTARQLGGADAGFDYKTFKDDYDQGISLYKRTYKSQSIKSQSYYWNY